MSNTNALKFNVGLSIGQMARQRALNHIQATGKSLPASIVKMKGSIATVKFETDNTFTLPQVTIPMYGPEYTRHPMQAGDKGVVIAMDALLGGMSGLGQNSPAKFMRPGNLGPLIFMPIGNSNWQSVPADKHVSYGPSGTEARPTDSSSVVQTDSTKGAGIAQGAPSNVDPTNIDLTQFDNYLVHTAAEGVKVFANKKNLKMYGKLGALLQSLGTITLQAPLTSVTGLLGAAGFGGAGGAPAQIPQGVQLTGTGQWQGSTGLTNTTLALSYQYVQPLTGDTITIMKEQPVTIIDPSGGISTLTINFPSMNTTNDDGCMIWLSFTQSVTTVTFSSLGTATFANHATVTAVPENSMYRFGFIYLGGAINKWFRI